MGLQLFERVARRDVLRAVPVEGLDVYEDGSFSYIFRAGWAEGVDEGLRLWIGIWAGFADFDTDGVGDACDICTDTDGDGRGNPLYPVNTCPLDNCPLLSNSGFVDTDMASWTGIPSDEMIQPADCGEIVRTLLRLSPAARVPVIVVERAGEDV